MSRLGLLLGLLCLLTAGLLGPGALGHTQRTAITSILFNPRTQMLEVQHRFRMHDAEHAVTDIFGAGADIVGSEETRTRFARYVIERFAILNGDTNAPLSLTFVGFEVEGPYIWIYQETPAPEASSLQITHNALRDIWPDQLNTVNVEGEFGIQSALLDGDLEIARIELKPRHSH